MNREAENENNREYEEINAGTLVYDMADLMGAEAEILPTVTLRGMSILPGMVIHANYWLQLAVNRMPSLSTPWLLLGDTHKFNFLTSVGATSYSTTCTTDLFAEFDLVNKLHNEYSCRFVHWYGYIPSYKNN